MEERGVAQQRFADDLAGRWLAAEIRRAMADGAALGDVDRAIALHIEEPYADPREFHKWVANVTDARAFEERRAQWQREREAEEALHQEEIARERAEPGYDERWGRMWEESRNVLRAAAANLAR